MSGTLAAVDLPFTEAIDFFRQKARVPSEHWADVWNDAHTRGFAVAGATSDALLADFQQAMRRALERGTTLAEFRRDFDAIVARHGWEHTGTPGWRAQIIYETNLATAYSAGRYAQMTQPDVLRAYPYWEYRHTPCRHPRLMHLAWDGLTLRADDPWWDTHYPPNGWRCGCRVAPVSDAMLRRRGRSGPDPSPPTVLQPWTNPRTGEVRQVPVGVDPGFGYNMGAAWKNAPLRASPLRPDGAGERQPGDAAVDRLRAFIDAPRGIHDLGPLPARLRAGLPGAPGRAVLPAETVRTAQRAGVSAAHLLLLPLLLGDGADAALVEGELLAALRLPDAALTARLRSVEGVAALSAVRVHTLEELARLLAGAVPVQAPQ